MTMTHHAEDAGNAHDVQRCVQRLRPLVTQAPRVALLLGSGWQAAAERITEAQDVAYAQLPGFPSLGVGGHQGVLRLGQLGGQPVAALLGRAHAYEAAPVHAMRGALRTLRALGCGVLIQTNAAGSLEASMQPGECMVINDHLNLVQRSPLTLETSDDRFVDMANAYDPALRALAHRAAAQVGVRLHEGVFAWMLGPQFETPAEIRMLQRMGAHAVGMSTVPETILARHAGMRVLALSLFTNLACGLTTTTLSHAQTLRAAGEASTQTARLLESVVQLLS